MVYKYKMHHLMNFGEMHVKNCELVFKAINAHKALSLRQKRELFW